MRSPPAADLARLRGGSEAPAAGAAAPAAAPAASLATPSTTPLATAQAAPLAAPAAPAGARLAADSAGARLAADSAGARLAADSASARLIADSASARLAADSAASAAFGYFPGTPDPDLDIVGALGQLDLDADAPAAGDTPASTPFTSHLQFWDMPLQPAYAPPFYLGYHGSLGSANASPAPASAAPGGGGAGGAGGASGRASAFATPALTWSTFIPASAPPLGYGGAAEPDLLSIRPFELPEEKPFGSPLMPYLGDGLGEAPFIKESGFGELDLIQALPGRAAPTPMWNHQYTPQRFGAAAHASGARASAANGGGHGSGHGGGHGHGHGHGGHGKHRFAHDLMNVHRKLHNTKRKGDDASKYASAKLEDFSGELYALCKDQHGCRFLQRQLDVPDAGARDVAATLIFNEIYLRVVELMTDPFGNYLIQKLLENVRDDQRLILVKNALPEFVRVALDPHGTRALQKLVECIRTPEESRLLVALLTPHVVALLRDLNGNHVVQKCLQRLAPPQNQFIFDAVAAHCSEVATHRHGCCVLQRCLDHGDAQQRRQLSLKVAENATNLLLDPFGNYVVQYVLARGDADSIARIVKHIRANVVLLSLHKFGSNVIEKLLRIAALTDGLIEVLLHNADRFAEMLNDAYGNYVLQTSLEVACPDHLRRLLASLQPLLPTIKNTPHGRRIMTKIQSLGP